MAGILTLIYFKLLLSIPTAFGRIMAKTRFSNPRNARFMALQGGNCSKISKITVDSPPIP